MKEKIISLHKYYIWAEEMRKNYDQLLNDESSQKDNWNIWQVKADLYLDIWYGCLYIVVEGWEHLSLSDNKIDTLIVNANKELLRQYRNTVFHYQEDYEDKRMKAFLMKEDTIVWIRTLHIELGQWFLNYFRNSK